jgi:hypothetical protein
MEVELPDQRFDTSPLIAQQLLSGEPVPGRPDPTGRLPGRSARRRWPGTSGSSPASRRDDSGRPNRQLAASASQKNGKAKHPRPAARNDTLPLW